MGTLDDIGTRLQQAGTAIVGDVDAYLQSNAAAASQGLVFDENAPNANRTALEIALGLFNTPPGLSKPATPPPPTGTTPGGLKLGGISLQTLLLPAIAVLGVYYFMRK